MTLRALIGYAFCTSFLACAVSAFEKELFGCSKHETFTNCSSNHDIGSGSFVWSNPSWPQPDVQRFECRLTIRNSDEDICRVKVTFEDFLLAQPTEGHCITDRLTISQGNTSSVFCGEEPDDFLPNESSGHSERQLYHVLYEIDTVRQVTLTITTTSLIAGKNWRLRVNSLRCQSNERYNGCDHYSELDTDSTNSLRSFNYPHSTETGLRIRSEPFVMCLGVQSAYQTSRVVEICCKPGEANCYESDEESCGTRFYRSPLGGEKIVLIPSNNGLSRVLSKPFLLDKGTSKHDDQCKRVSIELMDRTNGKYSKYCGGHFNPKSNKKTDEPVSFATDQKVLRIKVPELLSFSRGGYRFNVEIQNPVAIGSAFLLDELP